MAAGKKSTSGPVVVGGRVIGPGEPPWMVAELSANHNGDIDRALELMRTAKTAGADAVKLQTYTADTMTIDCDADDFRISGGPWDGYTLYDLYREAHTPWEWHDALYEEGRRLGLTVFSTPFDASSVELLERLGNPVYKIASFELVDLPLIAYVAKTGKPMIMSTGMASLGEIEDAVTCARDNGCDALVLLHCVSAYPAPPADANLRTLSHLAEAFGVATGLSDHTLGGSVAVAAAALGACVIEKHFTMRRADGGPDSGFSMEPEEFAAMAADCRTAAAATGRIHYERESSEQENVIFRRSIYAVRDIAAGERFTEQNIRIIRPGHGLAPKYFPDVLNRSAARPVTRGTPVSWSLVADD